MFSLHLPHPTGVFYLHHGWVLYLVAYLLISLPVMALLPQRYRRYWFAGSGFAALAAVFTLPVALVVLAGLAGIHRLPRLLVRLGMTPWQPVYRSYLAWSFLGVFLGLYGLFNSADIDFMFIAHWSGIAYGIPRAVDYVAGCMENRLRDTSLWGFVCYMLYFPSLMQGPIARSDDFIDSPDFKVTPSALPSSLGLMLFGWVKYSAAIMIYQVHPAGFLQNGAVPVGNWFDITLNLYITPLSGYLFFAAYTDLSRATSALMGKELPENFRNPFFTLSFRTFWRKYHISLTSWLRDFIYIPQGGNRRRAALNGFLVYLFIGLWHKPALAFIIWGSTQWMGVYAEQVVMKLRKRHTSFDDLARRRSFRVAVFPLRFALFWTLQAFSWSFFYGAFGGAVNTLGRIFQ